MKIDFSQPVMIGGIPLQIEKDKDSRLGDVCRRAINTVADSSRISLEDMVRRGKLAMKVAECEALDLPAEDVVLIQKSLPAAFPHPELVAIVYDMLDPKDAPKSA
jgi:hypothetical protein